MNLAQHSLKGTGLGLTAESTGLHYIFAAGTGIYPFLDLFDHLLESFIDPDNTTNLFKKGFKLRVFFSFREIEDFIGLELCEKLFTATQKKGLSDAFKLIIRVPGLREFESFPVVEQTFDDVFIDTYVDKNCKRVFVCGPPVFNYQVPISLNIAGIPKDKITLL